MKSLITVRNVNKTFDTGIQKVHVLKDVSVEIQESRFTLMYGPSGCGKSTLLHTILGLEYPSSGEIYVNDENIYQMTEDKRCDLRKSTFGIIQQQSNWIKSLNVLENVAIPLTLWGYSEQMSKEKAYLSLESVGMSEWDTYSPLELSSGQQQKVALARSLVNDAPILIADEPTGNLDQESGDALIKLIKALIKERGRTVIMITHETRFKKDADILINMLDGRIV